MITNHIHHTDALTGLRDLPDRAIQCCVTSPPYYGLRDYGHPRQIGLEPTPEAHFATYPPELITPCILAGSRPGDIILDPFIGSGTTAEVALRLQRQYIGFEINQDYITLAQKRLQPHTNNLFTHSPISVQ